MTVEALAAVETPVTETPVDAPAEAASEPSNDDKLDAPAVDDAKADEPAKEPELSEVDKYKHATQKRIDKLTAKVSESDRKYQELAQKLSQYEKPNQDQAPKEEDFNSIEEHLKALGAWEAKQEIAKAERAKAQEAAQKSYNEKMAARSAEVSAQEAEFRKVVPDYDNASQVLNEYVSDADKSSVGFSVFRDVLMSAPNLPQLTYDLGKNPDVLESLQKMEPSQIAWTLIERAIKLRDAPKDNVTKPSAPPRPVSGNSKASRSLDDMDYKDIKKAWKL